MIIKTILNSRQANQANISKFCVLDLYGLWVGEQGHYNSVMSGTEATSTCLRLILKEKRVQYYRYTPLTEYNFYAIHAVWEEGITQQYQQSLDGWPSSQICGEYEFYSSPTLSRLTSNPR
uniref:Uncharacterized protein n=1 Tax=Glossina austeni TaxID=7395 RepID=A0A1A9UKU0_GLOAU